MGLNLLASGHGFPFGKDKLSTLFLTLIGSNDWAALATPLSLHQLPHWCCCLSLSWSEGGKHHIVSNLRFVLN